MTGHVLTGSGGEWTLWNPDMGGGYRANFYTPTEPYLRKPVTVTDMVLADRAEKQARADGFVTLPELDTSVIAHWARADAGWLIDDVTRHLTGAA